MNKCYGGGQQEMRKSEKKIETYLGPFSHSSKLKVGDFQSMQFEPEDSGPFYLSDEQKQAKKYDFETDIVETKKYTRAQLIDALEIQCNLSNIRGTLKDVQQLTLQNNLSIQFTQKKPS